MKIFQMAESSRKEVILEAIALTVKYKLEPSHFLKIRVPKTHYTANIWSFEIKYKGASETIQGKCSYDQEFII